MVGSIGDAGIWFVDVVVGATADGAGVTVGAGAGGAGVTVGAGGSCFSLCLFE